MPPQNKNWRQPELSYLVTLVGKYMPATDVGWERVQAKHNRKFNTNRSASALSNKFKDLYQTKMPTGDPSMPDHIRLAKDIHRDFVERTGGSSDGGPGNGDDDEDGNDGDDGDDFNYDDDFDDDDDDDAIEGELANYFHAAANETTPNANASVPSTQVGNGTTTPRLSGASTDTSLRPSSGTSNLVATTNTSAFAAAVVVVVGGGGGGGGSSSDAATAGARSCNATTMEGR